MKGTFVRRGPHEAWYKIPGDFRIATEDLRDKKKLPQGANRLAQRRMKDMTVTGIAAIHRTDRAIVQFVLSLVFKSASYCIEVKSRL